MFRFIKQTFFTTMSFFSCNQLKYISLTNEECKKRPEIIIINSSEHSFYTCSIWLKLFKR